MIFRRKKKQHGVSKYYGISGHYGTMRCGETLMPIVGMGLTTNGIVFRGFLHGPLASDSGFVVVYDHEGNQVLVGASRLEIPSLTSIDSVTVTYIVHPDIPCRVLGEG
jgi:hypothetical protein